MSSIIEPCQENQQEPDLKTKLSDNSGQTRKHINNQSVGKIATTPANPLLGQPPSL